MRTSQRRLIGALAVATAGLVLTAPAGAHAQQVTADENTVTVSAVGRVTREPDQAVLMVAVESFAATAEEAAAENAEQMDALLEALRRLGLSEDQVQTISYQLHPEYDHRPDLPREPGEPRLVGYRAVNMVQVTIDDIDQVGTVIDTAIAAGADRVTGLSFQLRDSEAARRDALQEAIASARAEAQAIADALGRRLGPALAVTTTGGFFPPPRPFPLEARAEMAVPTPIQPGELEIQAAVTVVFRLEPRS